MVRLFKQFATITLLSIGLTVLLTACASAKKGPQTTPTANTISANAPHSKANAEISNSNTTASGSLKIEKVPFALGVSSVTVERIAKQNSCPSKLGAGLLYKKGPVEVYRVECEDGREIKARCEMRQCEIFKP